MTIPQAFALAVQHQQAGRLREAEALYRQILAAQPNHADAWHHLGILAHQMGRHDLAIVWMRRAILAHPDNAAAQANLGAALAANGQLDEAAAACRHALQLKPDSAEAHSNLSDVLRQQGQWAEAAAASRRAIELKPDFAAACNNLGNALKEQGEMAAATAAYHRALEIDPEYAEAHNNLGVALFEQADLEGAIRAYRKALELNGNFAPAHNNLGNALRVKGQLDEAVTMGRRALELAPGYVDAHLNLGNALAQRGELHEALAMIRHAVQLEPHHAAAHSNLAYLLHFDPGQSDTTIAAENHRWNQQFSKPPNTVAWPHPNDRDPARRLRIGYVSPDFRDHVIGRNLRPLFEHHSRREFEILCYSGAGHPDRLTDEFRDYAGHWRNTVGIGDEALAEMIRQDGVDILVDLTQHLAGNRLTLFAHRPAPVQISFAGYPASTGLETITYRISDRYLEAEIADLRAAEQVLLIDCFWCYDPGGMEMQVTALPALENGFVTFGSLNNFCKVNEPLLALWSRVLASVPNSRLLLLAGEGSHRLRAREIFERSGIDGPRLEFIEPCSRRAYMEIHGRLDIVLDPFPYDGHTTTLDALWMGVPVVSLAGQRSVSRGGWSQLSHLGLEEWVTFSEDGYVATAARLAHDLARLAELRAALRSRLEASVLMDASRFARGVEAAYRTMWQHWCAKMPS